MGTFLLTTMNINSILGRDSHWNVNKSIARASSIDAAIFLSDILSKREYYIINKMIENEESYFFCTVEDVKRDTTLGKTSQARSIDFLINLGFIETKLMGLPMRRNFKIIDEKIAEFLLSQQLDYKRPSNSIIPSQTSGTESTMIIKINNNNKDNNKSIVENPTDLSTTHLEDKKESLKLPIKFETELVEIYKYLTDKVGTSFKHTSSHNKFVLARLKEGRTVYEFKKVIDSKCTEWLNDEKMRKFLRPSTLFAPIHFDEYIESSEQAVVSTTSGSYVVSDSARADADAILEEQNYQRDKVSNYQIRNNLFQSVKTKTCYEAIFCDKSENIVTLLPIGPEKPIELETDHFKRLVYNKKIVMRKDLKLEELLDEETIIEYQEKYFDYFQKKV